MRTGGGEEEEERGQSRRQCEHASQSSGSACCMSEPVSAALEPVDAVAEAREYICSLTFISKSKDMATAADEDSLRAHLRSIPEYSTAKVNFYYSSLPSRKHSNPTGYSSALAWWRRTLVDLTARGLLSDDKLVLHVDEQLREKLRWDKAGRPTSLGVIVVRLSLPLDRSRRR